MLTAAFITSHTMCHRFELKLHIAEYEMCICICILNLFTSLHLCIYLQMYVQHIKVCGLSKHTANIAL